MNDLKICPFCVGKATVEQESIGMTFGIYCNSCTANKDGFTKRSDAVKAWNKRANESRITELEAELELKNNALLEAADDLEATNPNGRHADADKYRAMAEGEK